MTKKILTSLGIAAGVAVLAGALIAGAQTATTTPPVVQPAASQPMILQVGPTGKSLMRGTIASVANGTLTVNSWGGVWTVNVGSAAQVLPVAAGNDLTQFKAGDFVGIQGTVSTSAGWTIDATLVRDWTYRQVINQERRQNVQSANAIRRSNTPKDYVGTASNISGNSFILTIDGAADTVNAASGAEVVNRNWITMPISGIQSGDNVRVWGVNASGTITASIVRDVSIPATSSTQ